MQIELIECTFVVVEITFAAWRNTGPLGDEVRDRFGFYLAQCEVLRPIELDAALLVTAAVT